MANIYEKKTRLRTSQEGSGSDHNKSHSNPVSGTSHGRLMFEICSNLFNSGLSPPCMQIILSSMIAVHGKHSNALQNVFQILTL
mmetsp:Transcript_2243/g.2593  ORF Transcript_2243/g.2593 Transcript_2243/m.2593 type:complete len:84 (+) Transcript_2243:563-814(+)